VSPTLVSTTVGACTGTDGFYESYIKYVYKSKTNSATYTLEATKTTMTTEFSFGELDAFFTTNSITSDTVEFLSTHYTHRYATYTTRVDGATTYCDRYDSSMSSTTDYSHLVTSIGEIFINYFKSSFTVTNPTYQIGGASKVHYVAVVDASYEIAANTYEDPGSLSSFLNLNVANDEPDFSVGVTEFLPIIPLKELNSWIDSDVNAPKYKTAVKLAKFIGVDLPAVIEEIRTSNPGESNTQSLGVFTGVDIRSDNQSCKKYVYEFLKVMYYGSTISKEMHENPPVYEVEEEYSDVVILLLK